MAQTKEEEREYQKKWRSKNKDRIKLKNEQWYSTHRDEVSAYKRDYYRENRERIAEYQKVYRQEHKEEISIANAARYQRDREKLREYGNRYNRKRRTELKMEVMSHYSGGIPMCSCPGCEETEICFLTIDHINGGGGKHIKEIRYRFYEWLKKNNYPEGYRVMCFNCNMGRQINGGECPHLRIKIDAEVQE